EVLRVYQSHRPGERSQTCRGRVEARRTRGGRAECTRPKRAPPKTPSTDTLKAQPVPPKNQNPSPPASGKGFDRAGNETRTRDPDLGKVVLYQLSYSRI